MMKSVSSPFLGHLTVIVVVALTACFVESIRTAAKHKHDAHHDNDGLKDKLFHDNKRLRSERNTYISFGCLFLVLVSLRNFETRA